MRVHSFALRYGELLPLASCFMVLIALGVIAGAFTQTTLRVSLSIALSLFLYGILPGYLALLRFRLDALERVILAIPVSLTIVPLALYFVNLAGVKLSAGNILLVIALMSGALLLLDAREPPAKPPEKEGAGAPSGE